MTPEEIPEQAQRHAAPRDDAQQQKESGVADALDVVVDLVTSGPTDLFDMVTNGVRAATSGVADLATGAVNGVVGVVEGAGNAISGAADAVGDAAGAVGEVVANILS